MRYLIFDTKAPHRLQAASQLLINIIAAESELLELTAVQKHEEKKTCNWILCLSNQHSFECLGLELQLMQKLACS